MSASRKGGGELIGEVPELYSIFKGQVVSIQPYGIFIKIPGCSKNGLVHRSQISNTPIEKPEEIVEVGEKVYCKVISAEPDGNKIALSMKVVNQTTGKDLDPALVQTSLDEKQRKSFHRREPQRIELGAIFDTTCKKCGGKGHFAQDCFHRPGDTKYDLVDEETGMEPPEMPSEMQAKSSHKSHKKKDKKHKKKKKKKEKYEKAESSDGQHNSGREVSTGQKRHRTNSGSSSESSARQSSAKRVGERLPHNDDRESKTSQQTTVHSFSGHRLSQSSRKRSRSNSPTLPRASDSRGISGSRHRASSASSDSFDSDSSKESNRHETYRSKHRSKTSGDRRRH